MTSEIPKPTIADSLLGGFRQVRDTATFLVGKLPGKESNKTLAEKYEEVLLNRNQALQDLEAFESDVVERRQALTAEVERTGREYSAATQHIVNSQNDAKTTIDKFMADPMSVSKEDFDAASEIMRIKVE